MQVKYNLCILCKSDNIQNFSVNEMMFGSRKPYTYSRCIECNTLFRNDCLASESDLYPTNYYSFREDRLNFKEIARKFLYKYSIAGSLNKLLFLNRFFSKIFDDKSALAIKGIIESSDKILDIGCGNGQLITALATIYRSKQFTGVDPYINRSIEKLSNCFLLKQTLFTLNDKFDLIMMNHSFEHMSNSKNVLNHLSEILKPGGTIIIRIPVCDNFIYSKFQENWVQLDAPRHEVIFSENSLIRLLSETNLILVNSYSDSRPFSYIASEMFSRNIALTDSKSFFRSRFQNILNYKYWLKFNKANRITKRLNELNWGDQRVFLITHK